MDDHEGRLGHPQAAAGRAPERLLDGYLRQARRILAARPGPDPINGRTFPVLPDPLERLRCFELPPACLVGATGAGRWVAEPAAEGR